MSTGRVFQFIDFSKGTGGDTGEAYDAASVLPLLNGQDLDQSNIGRAPENIRQRTEAIRDTLFDALYMLDADRSGMCLSGPGLVSWGGSTTAAGTGILTLSDNLYLLPFLTPGFNQTPPVPPVSSKLGTLTLLKADLAPGIVVTSALRSYFAGNEISVVVVSGVTYGVQLLNSFRTIVITATATTPLSQVITSLNALLTTIPASLPVVTAVLAGGAIGADLILRPQAKQFISGNIDAEAHTITPAALTSFFATVGNRLAEGDTLCVAYVANTFLPADPAPLGGRRQSIPENTNTSIPAGSLFNSRVAPASLINALPICKAINGKLVFINGVSLPKDAAAIDLGSFTPATNTQLGLVQLSYVAGTPATPVVAPRDGFGGITNTAVTGPGFTGNGGTNGTGLIGQGDGVAAGVQGTGGGSSAAGVRGIGGTPNGNGVNGFGTGTGTGLSGTGGGTDGLGVKGLGGATNGNGVEGQGTGAGIGVKGTGGGTNGDGVKGVGIGTGAAVKAAASTNPAGLGFAAVDPSGSPVFQTDLIGFSGGWYNDIRERWYTGGDATHLSGYAWTITPNGGTGSATLTTNSYTNQQVVHISRVDDAIANTSVKVTGPMGRFTTTALMFMEWEASGDFHKSSTIGSGGGLGATTGGLGNGITAYVGFFTPPGGTNWQAQTFDGATINNIDTGVAVVTTLVANTRFRVEYLGASIAPGAVATARFYINGVLVATSTTNMPPLATLSSPIVAVHSTGLLSTVTADVYYGHVNAGYRN